MENKPAPRVVVPRLAAAATCAIFLYELLYLWHHQSRPNDDSLEDFPTFYIAAQYALQHRDIYAAGTSPAMMYVYPPLIAFLCTPLTLLSQPHAALVWLAGNTLMLLASVLLATRAFLERLGLDAPAALWPAALAVTLLSLNQIQTVLTMGETDAIMLFMFALALRWIDRRPVMAGLALALAANIKYLPIVALPWLVLRRRWGTAAGMLGGTVGFALLPAALLGIDEELRCLRVALGGLLRWVGIPPAASHAILVHDIKDGLSVSVTSALARTLGPHGLSNAGVLGVATVVAVAVLPLVWLAYAAHGLPFWRWPARRAQARQPFAALVAFEWAGLIALALAFSPDTNTRHLVLAAIVFAMGVAVAAALPGPRGRGLAIAGTAVICLSFLMPLGRSFESMRHFYYFCSIPGFGLLGGYLLLLWAALGCVAEPSPSHSCGRPGFRSRLPDLTT